MKIIELLNKIANGEEVPKKILYKYQNKDFYVEYRLKWNEKYKAYYTTKDNAPITYLLADNLWNLNDEVEIIEEETKPITKEGIEALGYACGEIRKCFENGWNRSLENKPFEEDKKIEKFKIYDNSIDWCCNGRAITDTEKDIMDKINEIIDYLMEDNK